MTELEARVFSTVFFTVVILLILYIVYYEYKKAKINEENSRIQLGEKENEDLVNSLSDVNLVKLANESEGSVPSGPNATPDTTNTKK